MSPGVTDEVEVGTKTVDEKSPQEDGRETSLTGTDTVLDTPRLCFLCLFLGVSCLVSHVVTVRTEGGRSFMGPPPSPFCCGLED